MNKKLLRFGFFLAMGAMVFAGCSKEDSGDDTPKTPEAPKPVVEVAKVNTSLLQKHSGTKCPPCGQWGWTMATELKSYSEGRALYLGTFSNNFVSEGFKTSVADDMESKWGVTGFPTFTVNGEPKLDRPSGSVNTTNEKKMCKDAIDDFEAEDVIANTGVKYTVADGKMKITSSVQFFKAAEGDYNVALYIVENQAMWKQSGHATGATTAIPHDYVLRGSANGTWGKVQMSGTIAAGAVKDFTGEMVIDPSWKMENVSVYAVLWKKKGSKYEFVNVSKSK